jgi:death-on-curing protein
MRQPNWISEREVLAIHDFLLAEHGGATGLRDPGLLASALARPHQLFAYSAPDMFNLAAAYTAGIVRNHPFVDGNKRTGFVVGILFLELHDYRFTAPEADATQAVLALAAGQVTEEWFAVWLRDNSEEILPNG